MGGRERNGLNRRIRKYTDEPTEGSNWTVREYYYNASWQCLEVRKQTKSRAGGEPDVAAKAVCVVGEDRRVTWLR